jgi:HAE1 family hydrophobic/amphiphilic exporter-1
MEYNMHTKKTNPLPRFAVNRPVTVITGLLALMVVGYIAFSRIAVEMMPTGFTPPFLGVWVPYPNSNPKEVEQQIAQPVEEQIQTISGVDRIRSWSQDNGCWTFIQFKQETDMSLAYSQLRDRMDRVKPELPDDIERIFVQKWSDDDWEVMWVAIIQKGNLEDPYFLVEQHVQKPLERIDGVAKIEIWGAQEKSIQIAINQNLVKSYKVNLYEVIQQLRNENFAVSSGYVKEGGRKIFVRSVGKFNSLEQIRNLPIRGANLLLKDIAQVKYDVPETEWRNLIDRKPAITFGVYKESMANTVALTEAVNKELIRLQKTDPKLKDFQFEILFNQGKYIMESVDNLKFAGMWGALFAFIILYFFLRRFRMTIIVTLAIPLSILITLTVMYFMNWTLNMITMMGLMISVGMVVDNSIVVLENIYTKRMSGLGEKDASLLGASEVGLAVTMATFTTVVVFLPLILMSEGAGDKFFIARIGLPVIF